MRHFIFIPALLMISACATTKASQKQVEVRPVPISKTSDYDGQQDFDRARQAARRGHYVRAYSLYQKLVARLPDTDTLKQPARLGLADSALSLSGQKPQLAESAKTIYLSLAMNEKLDPALRTLAKTGLLLVDLDKMEPQKAEVKIRQALIRQSDDVRLWNALGHISDAQNKWMQSLDAYVQALTIAKKNGNNTAPAINNIGMSLLMQGRYKEAILKFEHAAEIDSDKQLYDNNKRLALILSGQLDKAVEGLSKTRQAQIYNDAGVLAVRLGKYEHAEHLYQKALEISPVWFALAEANLEDLRGLTDREAKVETDQEKLESRMPQKVDKDGKDSTINTDRDEDYPVPRLSPHLMAEKSPTPF